MCCRELRTLTAPAKRVEKTFSELVNLMINHEDPKKNPVAAKFHFNMCNMKTGESASQYMAELVWRFFRFYVERLFSVLDKP